MGAYLSCGFQPFKQFILLHGPVPLELSKMTMLQALDILQIGLLVTFQVHFGCRKELELLESFLQCTGRLNSCFTQGTSKSSVHGFLLQQFLRRNTHVIGKSQNAWPFEFLFQQIVKGNPKKWSFQKACCSIYGKSWSL